MVLRLVFFSLCSVCCGYNVDPRTPVVFTGPQPGSFFGFSLAEHIYKAPGKAAEKMVLVGAPKANYTKQTTGVINPGKLYKCTFNISSSSQSCSPINYILDGLLGSDEFRNRRVQNGIEDKSNMWFGGHVHSYGINGKVVVCGHRYRVSYGAINNEYLLWPGLCFYHGPDMDESKFSDGDFNVLQKCYNENEDDVRGLSGANYHLNQFCMTGVGVGLKNLIVAAGPGATSFRGKLYYGSGGNIKPWGYPGVTNDSYLGYSVSSGNFSGNSTNDVVQGAPRDNHKGKVVVSKYVDGNYVDKYGYELPKDGDPKDINHPGSGFGYAVAGIDVNGDGYTDVVVGVPFYSPKGLAATGRVVVYLNDKGKGFTLQDVLLTSKVPRSHFGRSLSNAGDVNLDGYNDVAVGAPYEDGGAVYFFAGSKNGLQAKPAQVIKAADLPDGNKLLTFGYSLYGGLDMDGNGYPDLAVGAFASDKAFLLRSLPLLSLNTTIEINPPEFDLSKLNDTVNVKGKNMKTTLFTIKTCAKYEDLAGKFNRPVEIEFNMRADTNRPDKIKRPRVEFKTLANESLTVESYNENCFTLEAYLAENVIMKKIKYPDITFNLSFAMAASAVSLAKLNEAENRFATKVLKFKRDCIKCEPDLNLTDQSERKLAFGGETYVVKVGVQNFGDNAYGAVLKVDIPDGVKMRKVLEVKDSKEIQQSVPQAKTKETASGLNYTELTIDIGNPLGRREKKTFKIELNTEGYTQSQTFLSIVVRASSGFTFTVHKVGKAVIKTKPLECDNKEPLEKQHDNEFHLNVTIKSKANLQVLGKSQPQQVWYNDVVKGESAMRYQDEIGNEVKHTFFVRNLGPDVVPKANVIIQWPFEAVSGKHLLYLIGVEVEEDRVSCKSSLFNYLNLPKRPKDGSENNSTVSRKRRSSASGTGEDDTSNGKVKREAAAANRKIQEILDCNATTAKCTPIRCTVLKLRKDGEVEIKVVSRLWNATLYEDYEGEVVDVVSRASARPAVPFVEETDSTDNTGTAKTQINADFLPPKTKRPNWQIPVAVVCALIVLALIIFILYKCGFFKRKKFEGNISTKEKGQEGEKEPMFNGD